MTVEEVRLALAADGLEFSNQVVRRRMETYLNYPQRNPDNQYRDISKGQFQQLRLALAIESKGHSQEDVLLYIKGKKDKKELVQTLVNAGKADIIVQEWIQS